jgi:cell division protein FtsW (lipid II flippase)
MRVSRIAFLIVIIAAAVGLVYVSSSAFVVASGSDAGVDIYTTHPLAKLLALLLFCATTAWALLSRRASTMMRALAGALGLVVLAVATHVVVVSFKRSTLEERWLLVRFDRFTFDPAEGLAHDWEMKPALAGVQLRHRRDGRTVYIFTGLGPWRNDFATAADVRPTRT